MKPTVTVQVAPAASVDVQVVELKLNPVPVTEVLVGTVRMSGLVPVFVMVAVRRVAVCETKIVPKATGVIDAVGAA